MSLLSDIAGFYASEPAFLWLTVTCIISAVILWRQHKGLKFSLHWFISTKLLSFGVLFTILILFASAFARDFTHFSLILGAGGVIAAGLFAAKLKILEWKPKVKDEKPPQFKRFWVLVGFVIGVFALAAAWELFPDIKYQDDWITFGLLILLGMTFLLRAIPTLQFHVYLPVGIATWAGIAAPTWIHPFTFLGFTMTPGVGLTNLIVAVITFSSWIILTVILLWLSHSSDFMNKTLNSPPLLFITCIACMTWACMLVVLPLWSL
jgi:hypothetical protein